MHHGRLTKDIAAGLKELQKRIRAAKIPSSKLDETLNVATWNIRERVGNTSRGVSARATISYILA